MLHPSDKDPSLGTPVLECAQSQGKVKLGRVAIDSARIQANDSRDRVDSEQALRDTRARLRRQVRVWQRAADRDDQEPGGMEVAIGELKRALPASARRQVCAWLLGRDRGLGRPSDRGPAGDAERGRQRLAPAHESRLSSN
ncbi:MAG: hypothetical protein ACRD3N_07520 [Terracidiphilus sp.]